MAFFVEDKLAWKKACWRDFWVRSQKRYFDVHYYPQNGGSYYQKSGYIYTSFNKVGKLWWDPFQGGQGAIFSSIDGSGSSYPIGEAYNASRVIKYVAILGYRLDSYNLVDMRIHDINIVADLTQPRQSSAPSFEEGMSDGSDSTMSPATQETVNNHLANAFSCIATYWTGWWPTLHFVVTHPETQETVLHLAVDILGTTEIYDSDGMGTNEEDFNNAFLFGIWGLIIGLQLFGLYIVSTAAEKIPSTGFWGVAAVLLVMAFTAYYIWTTSHMLVDKGIKSAGGMSFWFLLLALTMFFVAAGVKKVGGIPAQAVMKLLTFIWPLPEGAEPVKPGIWTSLVFVVMGILFIIYSAHFRAYVAASS